MSRSINAASGNSRRRHRLSLSRRRIIFEDDVPTVHSPPHSQSQPQPPSQPPSQPLEQTPFPLEQQQSIGNPNDPITRVYNENHVTYTVHGDVDYRDNDDPLLIDINQFDQNIQNESQTDAQRIANAIGPILDNIDMREFRTSPLSPSFYSPIRNMPQSPDIFESPQSPQSPTSPEPQEKEIDVSCNICFITVRDVLNVNSSFVTSINCNHAVCFKCYVKIVLEHSVYKCFCSLSSANCRVYNRDGFVEFKPVKITRNKDVIKQHWQELLNNNTINNENTNLNYVKQLQQELFELRNKTNKIQHELIMNKSDFVMLQQKYDVCKLNLQKTNHDLEKSNEKNQNLQQQLDTQVSESEAKFSKFERCNIKLVTKLKSVMNKLGDVVL
ncbi:ie-2 [Palpita vitrealis nucleopolyhedrovirus]|uniref:Ie-2 n=1 Tax=Palpita vitrealis nucleopolyhedrovirus TaxID=2951960 RepID=A0AAE9LNK7_9ABAC|nr:ie-2 [Palpita vitrealis nucleopolyhedrovirus]